MVNIGIAKAAEVLAYYIKLSLNEQGVTVSPDMHSEIDEAVEAFKHAERAASELHSQHPYRWSR